MAVFPAPCTLQYCDANIPAMDKIYYFVKIVIYSVLSSQTLLNDEGLFGSMSSALYDKVNEAMSTIFGH